MTLLQVSDLSVSYRLKHGDVHAVDGVGFAVDGGDSLGIVGESGCGKSTIVAALMRILPPNGRTTAGTVLFNNTDLLGLSEGDFRKYRWKRMSVVFQSSMNALNPVLRVKEIFREVLRKHYDLSEREIRQRITTSFEQVDLPADRADSYPHELSGGMRQRVVIALSLICNPDILIADEPTTALDALVQARIMERIRSLQRDLGFGLILVSHDIGLIYENCSRIAVMYGGQIVEVANRREILRDAQHPYTIALMSSIPSLRGERTRLKGLSGTPPDLISLPPGCRFAPRCPIAQEVCTKVAPTRGPHEALCHFAGEPMIESLRVRHARA